MLHISTPGLAEFLRVYPFMAVRPTSGKSLVIKGDFAFQADHPIFGHLHDSFCLKIEVPESFPKGVPTVYETAGRIPKNGKYHVNEDDGSLCLGSPLALLMILAKSPSLCGFAEKCLVPYLFAVAHKLKNGGPMLFGELAHGSPGLLDDYMRVLGLKSPEQVAKTLAILGRKKRVANKLPCPCGCGVRVGKCRFNRLLGLLRTVACRGWFRHQLQIVVPYINSRRQPK